MKRFWTNIWVVGIGCTVIGSIILDVIHATNIYGTGYEYFDSLWHWIINAFNTKIEFSLYWIPVLVIVLIALYAVAKSFRGTPVMLEPYEEEPEWSKYRNDVFGEVNYRWSYQFYNNQRRFDIVQITPFCRTDEIRLIMRYSFWECPICKKYHTNLPSDDEIKSLITHRIEKKYNFQFGVG